MGKRTLATANAVPLAAGKLYVDRGKAESGSGQSGNRHSRERDWPCPPTIKPSEFNSNTVRFLLQSSLAVAAGSLALAFAPNPAEALVVPVNIGGTNYDITTFEGSYADSSAKFATPANNGLMPWWGDGSLAVLFAQAVGDRLGYPNLSGDDTPYFAFELFGADLNSRLSNGAYSTSSGSDPYTYAVLASPTAVPGPLPLFGAAAAFGVSRRLRRRIQLGG